MPFRPCRNRQTVALQLHCIHNCLGSCFASPPTPWYPQTDPPLCFKSVNSHRDGAPRGRHPCNSRCFCLKAAILVNVVAFSPSCFPRVSTVRNVQIVICILPVVRSFLEAGLLLLKCFSPVTCLVLNSPSRLFSCIPCGLRPQILDCLH